MVIDWLAWQVMAVVGWVLSCSCQSEYPQVVLHVACLSQHRGWVYRGVIKVQKLNILRDQGQSSKPSSNLALENTQHYLLYNDSIRPTRLKGRRHNPTTQWRNV